jgi:ABC-2 type transport system permease protein
MSKTFLVAQREYVENLRTKTFWIGILALPLLLTVFTVVSRALARGKDQRTYAVLDLSKDAWLSKEISQRTINADLDQWMRRHTGPDAPVQQRTPSDLRAQWQTAKTKQTDPRLQGLFDVFLQMDDDDLQKLIDAESSGRPPVGVMLKHLPKFTAALQDVDPKELGRMFSGMASSKFRQVPVDDLRGDQEQVEAKLRDKVNSGELFAYFVISADPEASDAGCRYVSTNLTDDALREWYARVATEVVRERRVAKLNLTKDQAASLQDQFTFTERTVSATGQEEEVKTEARVGQFAPMVFVYLLWIAVFSISQMLLTNTIEEKSNRIIEVLLSSVSPHQLMPARSSASARPA